MILEAFSEVLRAQWQRDGSPAIDILQRWLLSVLTEAIPKDNVGKVIQAELELLNTHEHVVFIPRSRTGETLLKSLYLYCESYERWQFGRWLHELKPHYFKEVSG